MACSKALRPSPDETIAALHARVVGSPEAWSELFALAETSYLRARETKSQSRYLAAAIYAYAFLFPESGSADRPGPFDPRLRRAADLYNLALTSVFSPEDGGPATFRSGRYPLPFGTIDISRRREQLQLGRPGADLVPAHGHLGGEGTAEPVPDPRHRRARGRQRRAAACAGAGHPDRAAVAHTEHGAARDPPGAAATRRRRAARHPRHPHHLQRRYGAHRRAARAAGVRSDRGPWLQPRRVAGLGR